MNRFVSHSARLALMAALLAALGLAGCGRKGPLDPPPAASVASAPGSGPPGAAQSPGDAAAPAGPRKRIPLDVLLN